MREIALSLGYVAKVDDADYDRLSVHKWHARVKKRHVYAVRNNQRGLSPRTIRMHREILAPAGGVMVDHKNGDSLDNRRENLRAATPGDNQANRRVVLSQHGCKGISYHGYTQNKGKRWTRRSPWKAVITVDYRAISLGYFKSLAEAAAAYDVAARKYFGEFAATNADLGLR